MEILRQKYQSIFFFIKMNINSNDDKDEQSTDIHTLELNESKTSVKVIDNKIRL